VGGTRALLYASRKGEHYWSSAVTGVTTTGTPRDAPSPADSVNGAAGGGAVASAAHSAAALAVVSPAVVVNESHSSDPLLYVDGDDLPSNSARSRVSNV